MRTYTIHDKKIADLVAFGLTYAQARRYQMHLDGISYGRIAKTEGIGTASVYDSVQLAKAKIER